MIIMPSNYFILFVLAVKNKAVSTAGLSTPELLHTMCCFKCDFCLPTGSNLLHTAAGMKATKAVCASLFLRGHPPPSP